MKQKLVLFVMLLLMSQISFAQEKKTEVGYYNGNRLTVGLFSNNKFYPEIQVESRNLEIQEARYALLLRNRIPFNEFNFVWGAGYSYSDIFDSYAVVPLEIKKTNLFEKNISLGIGIEIASDFNERTRIKPLIGVGISF